MAPGTSLAELTTLRLGGPGRSVLEHADEDALVDTISRLDRAEEPVLILGGGSNVVIADEGFAGTVLRVATRGIDFRVHGDEVDLLVHAGEPWDALVADSVADGLTGLEALSGIPGLTGATPIQNVGAYGQEVSQTISWLRVLDRRTAEIQELTAAECGFSYRNSVFRRSERYVVLAVAFRLVRQAQSTPIHYAELARSLGVEAGDRAPAARVREAVLDLRRAKGMVLDPSDADTSSAGSFFTNPIVSAQVAARLPASAARFPAPDGSVKVSAAWLIEQSGFARGYGRGAIAISTKHTLALTNRGGGTTSELLALAREIRAGVFARFGIELTPEPVLVGCTL